MSAMYAPVEVEATFMVGLINTPLIAFVPLYAWVPAPNVPPNSPLIHCPVEVVEAFAEVLNVGLEVKFENWVEDNAGLNLP